MALMIGRRTRVFFVPLKVPVAVDAPFIGDIPTKADHLFARCFERRSPVSEFKKIAAIVTTYYPRSHADVIVTKFLKGFPSDDGLIPPQVEIASLYMDQVHENDVGLELAKEHGVPVYNSIPKALTLGGGKLAVDGVLIVGEHGDYAWNEKEQHMYPRRFFFEQVCGVFAATGRSVPVFNDKHLAYDWGNSKWMYDRAQLLNVPFLAGSSVPLAWRNPYLEYGLDTPLEEALSIGYSGLDSYGFHALELLQCMVERRRGGETGIVAVQCLEGDAVWRAGDEGRWSRELADGAREPIEAKVAGAMEAHCPDPAVFLLEYADGLKAATLMLNGYTQGFGYAGRVSGRVRGMEVFLPEDPHAHFSYLSRNIHELFITGKPPYPVERTLLVSGALDALMDSRHRGHARVETPNLSATYRSYDSPPIRPTAPRPSGASLVPIVPWRN